MAQTEMIQQRSHPTPGMGWTEIYERLCGNCADPMAFSALEQRVRAGARRDLQAHGWHVAEDAIADTCAGVILSLPKARGAETFAGFVYGHYLNARRRVLADVRKTAATFPIDEEIENTLVSPEPLPDPTGTHLGPLRSYLGLLPPRERRAVELRHLEGATAMDIATELGVTEGNARRLVFNGLAHLRQRMTEVRPGEGQDSASTSNLGETSREAQRR